MAAQPGPARIPPLNFALVSPGVYRSGFPTQRNIEFLRHLGLRTVVRLSKEKYSPDVLAFFEASGTLVVDCATKGNLEPFTLIKPKVLRRVLTAMCIPDFHPVLVHCINGQQTTGCVVGCLRKAQGWALSAVFEEYRRHISGSKVRALDLQVIELCDEQPDAELLAADALDGGGKEARKKAKGAAGGGKTGAGGDGDPEAPAADRPREQMSAPAVAQAGGEERAAPVAVPAASLPASPIKTGSPTLGQPLLSSAATSPLSVTRSRSMPAPDN